MQAEADGVFCQHRLFYLRAGPCISGYIAKVHLQDILDPGSVRAMFLGLTQYITFFYMVGFIELQSNRETYQTISPTRG